MPTLCKKRWQEWNNSGNIFWWKSIEEIRVFKCTVGNKDGVFFKRIWSLMNRITILWIEMGGLVCWKYNNPKYLNFCDGTYKTIVSDEWSEHQSWLNFCVSKKTTFLYWWLVSTFWNAPFDFISDCNDFVEKVYLNFCQWLRYEMTI